MKIFGKNKETVVVNVKFDRFEKHVQKRSIENGEFKNTTLNGSIICTIDTQGYGLLDIFVKNTFGQLVERVINRICERDEKISNRK